MPLCQFEEATVPRFVNKGSDFFFPDHDLTGMGDPKLGHLIPGEIVNQSGSQRGSGRQGYSPMLGPGNGWCAPWYGSPNFCCPAVGFGYPCGCGCGYGGFGCNCGCGYGGYGNYCGCGCPGGIWGGGCW